MIRCPAEIQVTLTAGAGGRHVALPGIRIGAIGGFASGASVVVLLFLLFSSPAFAQTLGAAESYAIVAGTAVTAGGTGSIVTGDVGVSPGTAITGFDGSAATIAPPFSAHSNDGPAAAAQSAVTTAGPTPTWIATETPAGSPSPSPSPVADDDTTSFTQPANALVMPFDQTDQHTTFFIVSSLSGLSPDDDGVIPAVTTHWAYWSESCDHLADVNVCLTLNDTVVASPSAVASVDAGNQPSGRTSISAVTADSSW